MADYTATYVQRDVRQAINVSDLQTFSGFLKLCAGRTGQELNLSALGNDAGISHNTARAWISVLETSYIVHRLPAWHGNIRKQVVKAPQASFHRLRQSGIEEELFEVISGLEALRGAVANR